MILDIHVKFWNDVHAQVDNSKLSGDKRPFSPLMLASKNGHAKCVALLLENSADIEVTSERGYNCLMECINAGHE